MKTTTVVEQIEFKVEREGFFKNLKHQFKNNRVFLSEALQNARRSGASEIRITHDEAAGSLVIADNGGGIQLFECLSTLGKTGWDEKTQATDNPYGMGFAALVFAAEVIEIRSLDKHTRFSQAEALAFKTIDVVQGERITGTEITLTLAPETRALKIGEILAEMVTGFPVPVWFNGQKMRRPHAVDQMAFTATVIGQLSMIEAVKEHDNVMGIQVCTRFYFQGLPVEDFNNSYNSYGSLHRSGHRLDVQNILHLDPHSFTPIVPDRQQLHNAEEAKSRITSYFNRAWRAKLEGLKETLNPEIFADTWYRVCHQSENLDLLLDVPVPLPLLRTLSSPPFQLVYESFNEVTNACLPAERPQPGDAVLNSDELLGTTAGQMAYLRATPILDRPDMLPDDHWLRQQLKAKDILQLDYALATVNPVALGNIWLNYGSVEVRTCDSYRLSYPDAPELGVATSDTEIIYLDEPGVFLVPGHWEKSGGSFAELVRCTGCYRDDNDNYLENDVDSDGEKLNSFLMVKLSSDRASLLKELLSGTDSQLRECLAGGSFQVHFNRDGMVRVTGGKAKKKST